MKISIRTLKQEKYEFILDENDTIDKLKTLIFDKLGHEKTWQNLIFSGTMLDSNRTIASYKITENDFLVLLVKKPRAPVAPVAKEKEEETKPEPKEKTDSPAPATAPTATQPRERSASEGGVFGVKPEDIENMVMNLMEITGSDRSQVERALQASFFNADRAVEFLMSGVPIPDLGNEPPPGEGAGEEEEPNVAALFQMLRNSPRFNELRILARTNPQMLEQVLTQLPPEVLQVISQHQEEFIQLLAEEPTGQGQPVPMGQQQVPLQPIPQQQIAVNLSPEDQAVVDNLVSMGFSKNKVMEAYLLFDKDVEMTANYLLNHGWDDLQ